MNGADTARTILIPGAGEGLLGDPSTAHPDSLMKRPGSEKLKTRLNSLAAYEDARALVRLVQCPKCSRLLDVPVTLPCGNSLCRECLPEPHERDGIISYPDVPGRRKAFKCPFVECRSDHPASDCSVDVLLSKVMSSIAEVVTKDRQGASGISTRISQRPPLEDTSSEKPTTQEMPWGRLVSTYTLAEQGKLDYGLDVTYVPASDVDDDVARLVDINVLSDILEATNREVDCQVCYALMLDPVTTFCGHSLCRSCMARVLDYSLDCPVCRRALALPPSLDRHPSNKVLVDLLDSICPEAVDARAEAFAQDETTTTEGGTTFPLFVCTLGFPNQPTFLRIFEPRYRLMLRRCLEGPGQFGMLMYNRYYEPQGDLGAVHFYHYGTMLQVLNSQTLADGTSLVETTGIYRFRVTSHAVHDGYSIGRVERVEDVPLEEEERLEAEETAQRPAESDGDAPGELGHMTTQALFELCKDFITRMQARSANWLQQRVLDVHGQPPNDPATFPYWFASVLPIQDEEKYKLLGTTTVRQRLKITASWIRRIEAQRLLFERLGLSY